MESTAHKKPPTQEYLLQYARRMRSDSTDAEKRLWRILRNRRCGGFKFRRQVPIARYILDFYCLDAKLVVEADVDSTRNRIRRCTTKSEAII